MGERWFLIILLAIVCFSFGSFFGKLASLKDIPFRVYFFEAVGTLTVFTTFVIYNRNTIFTNFAINFPALLMGLCWGIGTVLFIIALKYLVCSFRELIIPPAAFANLLNICGDALVSITPSLYTGK